MKKSSIQKIFFGFLLMLFFAQTASAIPAFTRKYEMSCSSCHNAFPQLNQFGREFKEAGYRMESRKGNEKKIGKSLFLDSNLGLSGILIGRPYDKKHSGDDKARAVHEVEIIVAGVLGRQWSGYFEIEAEDETGFEPEFSPAVLTYHLNKKVNVQMVYGPMFWADPYGFLGDHYRLTRGHVSVIDQGFGGADASGKLRSTRQNVGVYGRPTDRFFYNVNISGVSGDAEGENSQNYNFRVAYDIADGAMIGAFGVDGEDELTGLDFDRFGIDFSVDVGDGRIQGAYTKASDDLDSSGTLSVDNEALSIQALYVFTDESFKPTWVPLLRYDTYEKNDGADEYKELTFNLGYYFEENVKVYFEYWDRMDAPTTAQEDDRFTVQFVVAF